MTTALSKHAATAALGLIAAFSGIAHAQTAPPDLEICLLSNLKIALNDPNGGLGKTYGVAGGSRQPGAELRVQTQRGEEYQIFTLRQVYIKKNGLALYQIIDQNSDLCLWYRKAEGEVGNRVMTKVCDGVNTSWTAEKSGRWGQYYTYKVSPRDDRTAAMATLYGSLVPGTPVVVKSATREDADQQMAVICLSPTNPRPQP